MILRDLLTSSVGNLWRMKLRASLTIAGVVIAIASFVAMVSFGAGMQRNVSEQFEQLGLFSTMQVYPLPPRGEQHGDQNDGPPAEVKLDQEAIATLSSLPGVELVYPFDRFSTKVTVAETTVTTNAQALPKTAVQTKLYSQFLAGSAFANDSAREVLITKDLLDDLNISEPDSILGHQLVITVRRATVDSGLARLFDLDSVRLEQLLAGLRPDSLLKLNYLRRSVRPTFDSLLNRGYLQKLRRTPLDSLLSRTYRRHLWGELVDSLLNTGFLRRQAQTASDSLVRFAYLKQLALREVEGAISRFLDGYMNARMVISDTLVISGVLKGRRHGRARIEPVIIPVLTARKFQGGGTGDDPLALFGALQSGALFSSTPEESDPQNYPRVTLNLDPTASHSALRDTIETLGFRAFSFAEQFDEIRRMFRYVNLALAAVGLIALVTASLGIANTMIMSILERRREIGILKSLGAYPGEIRLLFLAEAGIIGSIGAMIGIIFGWLITRVASLIARMIMEREGIEAMELFALPVWLVLAAYAIALVVSLAAGFYPATRAAHVDPVEALRAD